MRNSTTQNISEVLQRSTLTRIVERANELNQLNQKIQSLFPAQYQGLYRVMNLSNNVLTLAVQNATVRQGLYLQQADLLMRVREALPEVCALQFKVSPDFKTVA